jgi:hypothetical protein
MKDLTRSPLEFVRPMTEEEWQELVLRASEREYQRAQRRLPKRRPSLLNAATRERVLLSLKKSMISQ